MNAAVALVLAMGTHAIAAAPQVKTAAGAVEGITSADGRVRVFRGMPFAAPPVGQLRWQAPRPPVPWDDEYPALIYGANCPQRLHTWVAEQTFLYQWTDGWQSEDMLKVNIWTPSLTGSRPVMFYIHGGGFTFGSAYELASKDGAQLARHHDVMSVTVNHRLNILGFLDLQASQAQNRFYNELEDWLSSITDIAAGGQSHLAVPQYLRLDLRDLQQGIERMNRTLDEALSDSGTGQVGGDSDPEAMARLADAVQSLVQQMREEQRIVRQWAQTQSEQNAEFRRIIARLHVHGFLRQY